MIDITERVRPHLKPFFIDWEEYKLHLQVTKVFESPIRGFFVYELSGFATLMDEYENNKLIPPIEDILLSDTQNGRATDVIDDKLKQVIFNLLGCLEMSICSNIVSDNHYISNEVPIDNIV